MKTEKHFTEENMRKIIRIVSSLQNKTNEALDRCINPYQEDKVYSVNDITYYNGSLWICKSISTGNPPVVGDVHWEVIEDQYNEISEQDIINMMQEVTPEQWTKLQEVIVDDQISTNKVYSSSKTYTSIQDALDQAKAYTLDQIAKKSGMTYVIASSTANMTSSECFYLLENSGNYDIYIVLQDGTPKMVTSMNNIQLDGYLTSEEIQADYLKITDANSKFAEITAVDGKVDKTNVLNAVSSTPTTDNIYNAQVVNSELGKKANSADIAKMINHVGEYVATDTPRNDRDETYRLYHGKDKLAFQKFNSDNTVTDDFTIYDMGKGLAPKVLAGVDLNDVTYNAFLTVRSDCTNLPHTGANFIGVSVAYADDLGYGFQILCDANENQGSTNVRPVYIRHNYNNTWGDWTKIVTESDNKYKVKDYNNDLKVNNTITKLEDLLKLVPSGETWYIPDFNIDQTVTDYGFPEGMQTWGSMTITNSTSNGHYLIELQTNNNYQFYKRWIGETKNGTAGSNSAYQVNWKMCCMTGVPDVDKTFIPFTVPSTITVYNADRPDLFGLYYMVKNGICYVDVTMSLASISQMANFTVLCSGIPKPAISYVRNEINSWNDKTAPTLCMAINGGDSTFLITARNMSTSPITPSNSDGHFGYFCSFSYPVSES